MRVSDGEELSRRRGAAGQDELLGWAAESVLELFPAPVQLEPEPMRDSLADELR